MSSPHSESFDAHVRKRVGKACDRCRLKKSKCDGANPCSRCKADNAICVFGERKKAHDKVYPKGYVEMLEQQQSQLVAGLREMYRKLLQGDRWPGSPLQEYEEGNPLTHDILERLNVLHMTGPEAFEDNLSRLQQRLAAEARRRSTSTESEEPELSPHSTPGSRSLNFAEDNHSSRSRSSSPAKSHHPVQPLRQHYTLRDISSPDPVLQMWSDQKQWMVQTQETDPSGDFGVYNQFYPAVAPVNEALPANPAWMPGWNGVNQMAMGWSGADPDFADFAAISSRTCHR